MLTSHPSKKILLNAIEWKLPNGYFYSSNPIRRAETNQAHIELVAFLLFDDNCLRNMHAELVTCNLGQRVGIKIYSPLLVKFSILSSFSLWVFSRCVPLRVSMHHQRWNSKKTPSEREGERMPCNMSCANTIAINCRIHNNTLSTYRIINWMLQEL